jgi:hypothetical protein
MSVKRLIAVALASGGALAALALAGLPWAQASERASTRASGTPCFQLAAEAGFCFGPGPQGARGARGARGPSGRHGANGLTGSTGPIGATGPTGLRGPVGPLGLQGITGVQGPPGVFASGGDDPGYHTITVVGSKIGPIPSASGSMMGVELTPSVARCPSGGPDTEAIDGGLTITLAGASRAADVVAPENSYPGIFISQTEVDPLPEGSTPGAISTEPANAYEGQAIVTQLSFGDSVTVQAYVVCGP